MAQASIRRTLGRWGGLAQWGAGGGAVPARKEGFPCKNPPLLMTRIGLHQRCRWAVTQAPTHLDDVCVGLGHAAGHDADAGLSHQLDRHLGGRVDLVQVVDQLGQVLRARIAGGNGGERGVAERVRGGVRGEGGGGWDEQCDRNRVGGCQCPPSTHDKTKQIVMPGTQHTATMPGMHPTTRHTSNGTPPPKKPAAMPAHLNGVDVVVGGRADEGHARLAAAQVGNVGRHLLAGQLAALSGLGALQQRTPGGFLGGGAAWGGCCVCAQ